MQSVQSSRDAQSTNHQARTPTHAVDPLERSAHSVQCTNTAHTHQAGVDSGNWGRSPSEITVCTSLVGVDEKLEKAGTPVYSSHMSSPKEYASHACGTVSTV